MGRPREMTDEMVYQGVYAALIKTGYGGLTLDKIAAEIGLSPAALSKRFGSKKALLLFYMDYVIAMTNEAFENRPVSGEGYIYTLESIFVESVSHLGDPRTVANSTSLYLESNDDPELLERSRLRVQLIDRHVRTWLERAVEAGELKLANIGQVSDILQASISGSLLIWLKDPGKPLEQWVRDSFAIVLGPYRTEQSVPQVEEEG
ncbi:TetR/AcrR family transcriptional regulator [Paenibacillus daejeonensis]|uniref:TetR/AcrR family transcriptional regulator n=1 Tax=Paenibacillus daejeonensis TaxID=135193 RepID=UPI000362D920|nr:TetR/AcrR family transcriptional regulator [Paenibacillus daejeonensis]